MKSEVWGCETTNYIGWLIDFIKLELCMLVNIF